MLHRTIFWLALALPIAVYAGHSDPSAASDLPPGPMRQKVSTACLECHDARIIVQQRLSKAAWTKEVDKMSKWGALVEPSDRDPFIDYLSTNFPSDKPPYLAAKSASPAMVR